MKYLHNAPVMKSDMHAINKTIFNDVSSLFDENKLIDSIQAGAGDTMSVLKDEVSRINQGLKKLYLNGAPVEDIVFGRASLMDRLLTTLYPLFFPR